jgi:hypothetical protein
VCHEIDRNPLQLRISKTFLIFRIKHKVVRALEGSLLPSFFFLFKKMKKFIKVEEVINGGYPTLAWFSPTMATMVIGTICALSRPIKL